MSPAALFTMAVMPIVGFLLGKKVDGRFLMPVGLICAGRRVVLDERLHPERVPLAMSTCPGA